MPFHPNHSSSHDNSSRASSMTSNASSTTSTASSMTSNTFFMTSNAFSKTSNASSMTIKEPSFSRDAIFIVFDPQATAKFPARLFESKATIFLNAVTGGQAMGKVVKYDYPGDQQKRHIVFFTASCENIETAIQQRMKTSNADNGHVARILYFRKIADSKPQGGPVSRSGSFLGLSGGDFYRKCLIVVSSADQAVSGNGREGGAGFRTARFDGTKESAWSAVRLLLDGPQPIRALSPSSPLNPGHSSSTLPGNELSHESTRLLPDGPLAVQPLVRCNSPSTLPGNGLSHESTPLTNDEKVYIKSGIATGRHHNKAFVLLVGNSGHGKSKTINRLVGRNLLDVGRGTLGSTTDAIQRVTVPVKDDETGLTVTIAFDDTPGFEDTTYSHRDTNTILMRQYKQRYFPEPESQTSAAVNHRTFPNVILLVATWDSITPDAHNEPAYFTSAVGKSMFNLSLSGLVDRERSNVIVVVTKSMSSWHQLDDYESEEEKNKQWNTEAGRRIGIIVDLQRKVFPKSTKWPVIFIENGGGMKRDAPYSRLPNGELSHQNLFETILNVIAPPGQDTAHDLAGLIALRLLTGAEPLDLARQATTETLLSKPHDTIIETPPIPPVVPSPSDRISVLADEYLGVTYNPVSGVFGRTCVLELDPSNIKIKRFPGRRLENSAPVNDANQDSDPTTSRLAVVDFKMRDVPGLSSHYSSSFAFKSSRSAESKVYLFRCVSAVANVPIDTARLSKEMMALIEGLPPLPAAIESTEPTQAMQEYHDFFASHGTHVVLCVAFGGVLRVVSQAIMEENAGNTPPYTRDQTLDVEPAVIHETASRRSTETYQVMIFRDGGAAVASQLTRILEQRFSAPRNLPSVSSQFDWTSVCMPWIDALENDPVFCPDDEKTEYRWLYDLAGLTKKQKADLERASKSYLEARAVDQMTPRDLNPVTTPAPQGLNRQSNRDRVVEMIRSAWNHVRNMF